MAGLFVVNLAVFKESIRSSKVHPLVVNAAGAGYRPLGVLSSGRTPRSRGHRVRASGQSEPSAWQRASRDGPIASHISGIWSESGGCGVRFASVAFEQLQQLGEKGVDGCSGGLENILGGGRPGKHACERLRHAR